MDTNRGMAERGASVVSASDDGLSPDDLRYAASIFKLLASTFEREPDDDYLDRVRRAADDALNDGAISSAQARLFAALHDVLGGEDQDPRAKAAIGIRVRSEYAELFIGPRPALAPLYESMYLGFPLRMFSDRTMEVRAWYSRFHFSIDRRGSVPDDHIGYELAFMARLFDQRADELSKGTSDGSALEGARQFLAERLVPFVRLFADRVGKADFSCKTGYYEAWTNYLRSFVEQINDVLSKH